MSDLLANLLKENTNKMDTGSDLVFVNLVNLSITLKYIELLIERSYYDVSKIRFILDHPDRGKLDTNKLATDEEDAYGSWEHVTVQFPSQKLTAAGRTEIKNWFIGDSATGVTHIAVGDGVTPFSVDDTTLENEHDRLPITTPTFPVTTLKRLRFIDVIGILRGNSGAGIGEVGLLNASSGGTLFSRGVLPFARTKDNTMRMRITQEMYFIYTLPFTHAGTDEVRNFIGGFSSTAPTHIAHGDGTGFSLEFPYIADSNTVLLLHMNEDSGSDVNDISSSNNNGTATGTTIISSYFDDGRDFNGNSDYILVSDDTTLQLTNNFTIEMWINADGFTQEGGADRRLLSKTDGSADGYEISLTTAGKVNFRKWDAGGSVDLASDTALSADTWTHIVCVQTSSGGMRIYINGVLDKSNSDTDAVETDTTDLYIGRRSDAASGHFDGTIDEIRISNIERHPISITDTEMLSEQVRNAVDFSSSLGSITGFHEATLSTTQANGKAISRTALFNAASNGDMFTYQTNPVINKTQKMAILTRHTLTFI